ncbi:hypothetical protein A9Q99_17130 [Gammaproteobacteria bacterium 45_16_T64]|nr:hypothetical protein A9Q99_17130 [Gammaproteobacteria bacterium 45_16_T64]
MQGVLQEITLSDNIFYSLFLAYIVQLLIYFVIAGAVSLIYGSMRNVLGVGALIDDRKLKPNQRRREILSSLMNCGIYALFMVACCRVSDAIVPSSFLEAALQIGGFLLFFDFINYFTHRLLHTKKCKRFHNHHHQSIRVTPWSTLSLHPVETILNQIPYLLFVLIFPVSSLMVMVFYIWFMVGMANGHSNYNPFANVKGWGMAKRYFGFHQAHHEYGRYNFGFIGTHWDWLFGTIAKDK